MAIQNPNLDVSQLDFQEIKNGLRNYLKGTGTFQNYDFEGTNLSALIDVLAYNTYINSHYLQMVGSEMFLDTATLRDSIISHCKSLNYVPRSKISAVANVDITFTATANVDTFTLPKGTKFTTSVQSNTYTFTTDQSYILQKVGGQFTANNILIYEGDYYSETYVVNTQISDQRFVISNANVDTRSITVNITESNTDSTNSDFLKAENLYGLDANSEKFFLQAAENLKYEVVFGDGNLGKSLKNGNIVNVMYRMSRGAEPNSANVFTGTIGGAANVAVTTRVAAAAGADRENITSIKFNAPRHFASQERAVTVSDYKALLKTNFPEIDTLAVFGGQDQSPPQYGKVFVSIKPIAGTVLSNSRKTAIIQYLRDVKMLSITPEIIDPEYLYIKIDTEVKYNSNDTTKSINDISTLVRNAIQSYKVVNIAEFDSKLRGSKLIAAIDSADASIISNETTIKGVKYVVPLLNTNQTFSVSFGNRLKKEDVLYVHPAGHSPVIQSTAFTYEGQTAFFKDDGNGTIYIYALSGEGAETKLDSNAGTVDYTTGIVSINNLLISGFNGDQIKIIAELETLDVDSSLNTIIDIRNEDISIDVTPVTE